MAKRRKQRRKNKAMLRLAWILGTLGLIGVVVPHAGFLFGIIPTLDVPSHSILELISAGILLTAFLVKP